MEEIAPNVYVTSVYPGINIGLVVTGRWAVVIDVPPFPSEHQAWRKTLRSLGYPISYLILTDDHPDRWLGALWIDVPIIAGRGAWQKARDRGEHLPQILVEEWNRRHAGQGKAIPALESGRLPVPEIVVQGRITLEDSVSIVIEAVSGPTPGSLFVWLPQQGVLFTGDVVAHNHLGSTEVPSFARWLETLTHLEDGALPARVIVPGRGPVGGPEVVRPTREYLLYTYQRLQAARVEGRRPDLPALAETLLPFFPFPEGERDRWLSQIRAGLERWWEEMKR